MRLAMWVWMGLFSWNAAGDSSVRVMTFQDAIAQRLVDVKVMGRQGTSGDSVWVQVRRASGVNVDIDLKAGPGTVFQGKGDVQDMAAYGVKYRYDRNRNQYQAATTVRVRGSGWHEYVVEAYCTHFGRRAPRTRDVLVAVDAAEGVVVDILRLGKKSQVGVKVIQGAVWIETDQLSDATLQQRFGMTVEQIEAARQLHEAAVGGGDQSPTYRRLTKRVEVALAGYGLTGVIHVESSPLFLGPRGKLSLSSLAKAVQVKILNSSLEDYYLVSAPQSFNKVGFIRKSDLTLKGERRPLGSDLARIAVQVDVPGFSLELYRRRD